MNKLISVIDRLTYTAQKYGIRATFAKTSEMRIGELRQKLAISPELVTWYSHAAPLDFKIDWSVEWLNLSSPDNLMDYQLGYRYKVLKDGKTAESERWNPNWVVIGDRSSDPIIADVMKEETPISMAVHGVGYWSPDIIAPNLAAFLDTLTVWLELTNTKFLGKIYNDDYNDDYDDDYDDDCTFNEELRDALWDNLRKIMEDEYITNFMKYV